METLLMLVVYGSIAVVVLALRARRRDGIDLRRSFDTVRFETPAGVVGGDAVRVVRIRRQGLHADVDPFDVPPDLLPLAESFWYCVAPGPAYFVAISSAELRDGRMLPAWTTRSLTEAQLRAALADDPAALAAAFAPPAPRGMLDVRYAMHRGTPVPAPGAGSWPAPPLPAHGLTPGEARRATRDRWLRAGVAGMATAVLLVPPAHAFYWGWTHPDGVSPWLQAAGRAVMSWLVYLYMLVEGEILWSEEGRSVAIAFVACAALFALLFVRPRHGAEAPT